MSSGANFLDVFDDDEEPDLSESLAPAMPARQEVVFPLGLIVPNFCE